MTNLNELRKERKITELFEHLKFQDPLGHELVNCVDFIELKKDAETLAKARAVLAENADVASASRDLVEKPNYETTEADVLLVKLINALEGAGND